MKLNEDSYTGCMMVGLFLLSALWICALVGVAVAAIRWLWLKV